jgi:hypothetical protein
MQTSVLVFKHLQTKSELLHSRAAAALFNQQPGLKDLNFNSKVNRTNTYNVKHVHVTLLKK